MFGEEDIMGQIEDISEGGRYTLGVCVCACVGVGEVRIQPMAIISGCGMEGAYFWHGRD